MILPFSKSQTKSRTKGGMREKRSSMLDSHNKLHPRSIRRSSGKKSLNIKSEASLFKKKHLDSKNKTSLFQKEFQNHKNQISLFQK